MDRPQPINSPTRAVNRMMRLNASFQIQPMPKVSYDLTLMHENVVDAKIDWLRTGSRKDNMAYKVYIRLAALEAHAINSSVEQSQLLSIPTELRMMIFNQLFKNAKMIFKPRARRGQTIHARHGQSNVFKKENMPTDILLTCQTLYEEGTKVLFENLVVVDGFRGGNFGDILSVQTAMKTQYVLNMNPIFAVETFDNLKEWTGTSKYHIVEAELPEFKEKDSVMMYQAISPYLADNVFPCSYAMRNSVGRLTGECPIFFLGKFNISVCRTPLTQPSQALFREAWGRNNCRHGHRSVGHVYVDFNNRRAIFDDDNRQGHVVAVKALRELSKKQVVA